MNAALRVTRSEPAVREVPVGADATLLRDQRHRSCDEPAGWGEALPRRRCAPGQTALSVSYEGVDRLRSVRQEGGVHARLPRDGRHSRRRGRLPRRQQLLVSLVQSRAARVRAGRDAAGRRGTSSPRATARRATSRGRARWESGGAMDEIYLVGGPLQVWRDTAGSVETLVYLHDKDDATGGEVPGGDGAVPRDVPPAHRAVSLPQVRARRELLGDRLRHAVLHAARPRDHPLPVHHQLVLPARDPAQLVGELGLRRLRVGQLVRGADGVPGRPPDRRSSAGQATSTAARRCRSTATTSRTAATSRSPRSARARAPRPRPSATARR